jgi:excinuclease ABC subunit C
MPSRASRSIAAPARHKGNYYGPFASAGSVNTTINALAETLPAAFSCTDSFFNNRDRPCLLYQIKRCSGPCVGRIGKAGYAELVADAKAFLGGKSTAVQAKLGREMEGAAEALDFERAAILRDRLKALTFIQGSQAINASGDWQCRYLRIGAPRPGSDRHPGLLHPRRPELGPPRILPDAHAGPVDRRRGADQLVLAQFYEEVPPREDHSARPRFAGGCAARRSAG